MNRRKLLSSVAAVAAMGIVLPGARHSFAAESKIPILIFSKHLQFISDYDRMAATAAEIGFDGLDVTVRPGGHVLPGNAGRDLPRLAQAAKKAGLPITMITTAIQDAAAPGTRAILKTAAGLGIRHYRIGDWKLSADEPIPDQLARVGKQLAALAELSSQYNIVPAYQNHSGEGRVGASIWDLWTMMKDLDPQSIGINFDLGHATVEGGTAWPTDFQLVQSRTRVVTLKDFKWKQDSRGRWRPAWCPLGEGMIDAPRFLKLARAGGFAGPITLHFEYDVDGDEGMIEAMRRDLATARGWLKTSV